MVVLRNQGRGGIVHVCKEPKHALRSQGRDGANREEGDNACKEPKHDQGIKSILCDVELSCPPTT